MIKPSRNHKSKSYNKSSRSSNLWAWPMAALSATAGLALAAHYPLSPTAAIVLFLLASGLAWRFWTLTPWALAILPVIGLAPWTGWITFEELDLLVLACAAGGYVALGLGAGIKDSVSSWRRPLSFSAGVWILMLAFAGSVLLSIERGFADAGGFQFGWYQGYHEAMNSLRLGKSYLMALWLLPLWLRAAASRPQQFSDGLLLGVSSLLALASAAALWERVAFPGLMNFSSDYRSTALFWEMHVGGAAFDGCLAIAMPFALHFLMRARKAQSFVIAMALMLLATYASLTTFSRGVYLAVPLSVAVYVALRYAQSRASDSPNQTSSGAGPNLPLLGGLLMVGGYGAAALMMFMAGGYRALLALLGVSLIFVLMPPRLLQARRSQGVASLALGALIALPLAALCWSVSAHVPKAAYGLYALVFVMALGLRWWPRPGRSQLLYACAVDTLWFWLLASSVIVADYWAEGQSLRLAAAAMAIPALVAVLMRMWPSLWPFAQLSGLAGWRARAGLFGAVVLLMAVISTLMAGSYMRDRSATSGGDMQVRLEHWRQGISMLHTPTERWLGKGSGRFVANHFFIGPQSEQTGDYRLKTENGRNYLLLTAGKHVQGWGEMFRISQRISAPQGASRLKLTLRVKQDMGLHTEVCEKHLLYNEDCLIKQTYFKAQTGGWQTLDVDLGSSRPMGGDWYAPRLIAFSVAVETPGAAVEIAEMQLTDSRGEPLLKNGDFSAEMAHWFFSSDRHHMPWHIKQMALHVWFDQGLLGLGLLSVLVGLALVRLSFGRGRGHELAPAVAAGLVGFLVVGLFDSLLDAPRMAFLFYLMTLLGLGLRGTPTTPSDPADAASVRSPHPPLPR
ncbi:hypothetical protein [Paucibacter sp. Y2R2-4]|uniref:hypothetical protein n=1 Tax=Paucibacter sp. Y2R2-4 TaxID=2893553 RepID=UPI0021E36C83|nr:hypothetical protein [Paucibacter sp. Y2R2-4]MCV2350918.1 hypothetical protein [Paucibacter sp. Y2R2-4]